MDVVTHAIVGAATGLPFGMPLYGACVAVLPDVVLGVRRRNTPSGAYNATHSVLCLLVGMVVALLVSRSPAVALCTALCLFSHLALDLPTHGKKWAPPLLWPFLPERFSFGDEWEFFNQSWFVGASLSIIWILLCVLITMKL